MPDKMERAIITLALSISAIMLVAVVVWRVVFFTPEPQFRAIEPQPRTNNYNSESPPAAPAVESSNKAAEPKTDVIVSPEAGVKTEPEVGPKTNLRDVIRAARSWRPVLQYYYGRRAPDFTLTDINGRQHKLSDYRGRDVLINFWATWCGPCKIEVPHLIALRKTISEDKLAILAISYRTAYPPETTEKVKNFAKQNGLNYTVFSVDVTAMTPPFSNLSGIPCSFFIDPEGKIKLATEGLVPFDQIKAILEAEY